MTSLALPVDYDACRRTLVQAVALGVGLPSNQIMMMQPEAPNAPRPCAPYVGIRVLSPGVAFGWDCIIPVADAPGSPTGLFTSAGPRSMLVSFESFGASHEQAYGVMAALQAALQVCTVQQVLDAANMAVCDIGPIRDLSTLLLTSFEGRTQMDVTFGLTSELTVDAGYIDSAPVSGSVTIEDNQQVAVSLTATGGA